IQTSSRDGKGQTRLVGRSAIELEFDFPAPPREAAQVGQFTGRLTVLWPSKMMTFTFDRLTEIARDNRIRRQEREGVNISVRRFQVEGKQVMVEIGLDYPPGGPHFESYQSWLENNAIVLEKRRGTTVERLPASDEGDLLRKTDNQAVIRYFFLDK